MSPKQLEALRQYILNVTPINRAVIDETLHGEYIRINLVNSEYIRQKTLVKFRVRFLFFYNNLTSNELQHRLKVFNEKIENYNFYLDTDKEYFLNCLTLVEESIYKNENSTNYIGRLLYSGVMENKYIPEFVISHLED